MNVERDGTVDKSKSEDACDLLIGRRESRHAPAINWRIQEGEALDLVDLLAEKLAAYQAQRSCLLDTRWVACSHARSGRDNRGYSSAQPAPDILSEDVREDVIQTAPTTMLEQFPSERQRSSEDPGVVGAAITLAAGRPIGKVGPGSVCFPRGRPGAVGTALKRRQVASGSTKPTIHAIMQSVLPTSNGKRTDTIKLILKFMKTKKTKTKTKSEDAVLFSERRASCQPPDRSKQSMAMMANALQCAEIHDQRIIVVSTA